MPPAVQAAGLAVERFSVIVEPAPLGRCISVRVEPGDCAASHREFPTHPAAMAFAEQVAKVADWPIRDRCGL